MSYSIDERSNRAFDDGVHWPRSPYPSESYRRPRSPLVPENQIPTKVRHNMPSTTDLGARIPRSSPLSVPTSRNTSGRSILNERPSSVGISRSPYTPVSKFFVTVIPPAELATEPSSSSSRNLPFAGTSHLRRGTLMPLYPTLGGQLYAISREYGLPSIGGLTIFLCDDGDGNLGPRIGEETWPYLWGRYFDDSAEDLYHDITNPTPMSGRHSSLSTGYNRQSSFMSGDMPLDKGTPNRRDEDGNESYETLDPRDQTHASRRVNISYSSQAAGSYGASPRQYMTPSPLRTSRPDWHASPASSAIGASRLPIVARIEWTVDKARAPWWNHWIGASTTQESRLPADQQTTPITNGRPIRRAGRRSMHLPRLHGGASRASRPQSPVQTDAKSSKLSTSHDSIHPMNSDGQGHSRDNSVVMTNGYTQLDDDVHDDEPVEKMLRSPSGGEIEPLDGTDHRLIVTEAGEDDPNAQGYDAQSYAGFSAVMGVVNGRLSAGDGRSAQETSQTTIRDGESIASRKIARQDAYSRRDGPAFDVDALEGSDEGMWRDMRAGTRQGPFDGLSASSLSIHKDMVHDVESQDRGSAVHEWISKTQSPPQEDHIGPFEDNNDDRQSNDADDEEMDPQDDVAEVVGLWAEKAVDPDGLPLLAGLSQTDHDVHRASRQAEVPAIDGPRSSSSAKNSSAASSRKHARGMSNGVASSSQRSSRRSSRRTGRASQDIQLLSAPGEHKGGEAMVPLAKSGEATANKLSLLSPIALQESSATFSGPAPELDGFLPAHTSSSPSPQNKDELEAADPVSKPDLKPILTGSRPNAARENSYMLERPTISSPGLLSSHLEPPSARSPGQMSGSSSASDLSDALVDMERALALLSPAGFQKPASVDQAATSQKFAKRNRIASNVSASESMARARSLSASVSPSARWFRSANDGVSSVLPNVVWPSEASNSAHNDLSSAAQVELSPRPVSLSAATFKAAQRVGPEDVAALATLSKNLTNSQMETPIAVKAEQDATIRSPITASDKVPLETKLREEKVSNEDKQLHSPVEEVDQQSAAEESPTTRQIATLSDVDVADTAGTAEESGLVAEEPVRTHAESEEAFALGEMGADLPANGPDEMEMSYGSSSLELDMLDQWIAAQHKQLPGSPATDPLESHIQDVDPMEQSVHDALRPQRTQTTYATVGVQAEIDSSDRDSSQFSLVSGDATSESGEAASDDEGDESHDVMQANVHIDAERSPPGSEETPRAQCQSAFDQDKQPEAQISVTKEQVIDHVRNLSDTKEQHMAFERLIRGSFAESISDVYSSQAVSPHLPADQQSPWLDDQHPNGEAVRRYLQNIHGQHDSDSSPPHDDSTTTRGGGSTTRNSALSAEQWSQDGSAYDDQHEEGDDGTRSQRSFDAHHSRISDFSNHLDALENAGGRTPTFLYDRHLLGEDEQATADSMYGASGQSLSPLSAQQRPSPVPSPRPIDAGRLAPGEPRNNQTERPSDVDALGINMASPSARMPMPSVEELMDRHRIVSLAGEPVGDDTEQMPTGFEQVHVQSPTRPSGMASRRSTTSDGAMQERSDGKSSDAHSRSGRPGGAKLLRRSMGSISERHQKEGLDGRRASASAEAAKSSILAMPGPRSGATLLMARDGSAIPVRRSISPASPRHRFGTLPPSPSLQGNVALFKNSTVPMPVPVSGLPGSANVFDSSPDFAFSSSIGGRTSSSHSSPNLEWQPPPPSQVNGLLPKSGSALVIDTAKAQALQTNSLHGQHAGVVNGQAAYPYAARAPLAANQHGSPLSESTSPSSLAQFSTPPVFRGTATSSTPPSPRGPRAQPFSTPPTNAMPTGVS